MFAFGIVIFGAKHVCLFKQKQCVLCPREPCLSEGQWPWSFYSGLPHLQSPTLHLLLCLFQTNVLTHTHTQITKEIWISLCLPATNTAMSRKAKPNARSLSHRYMVISGNQPNSWETACVLLKGKIMVISEPMFLCKAESRRKEVNTYSWTGVLSDRGDFPPAALRANHLLRGSDVRFGFTNFSKRAAKGPLCRKSRKLFKVTAKASYFLTLSN